MISAEAFLRRNPVASQDMPIAEQRVQSKPPGRFSRRGRDAAVVEDPNDLDACREAALRLLDAAPRASGALRERLLSKGYGEAIVDEVIERLIRVQLIDDRAYAESAVRYCAGRMMVVVVRSWNLLAKAWTANWLNRCVAKLSKMASLKMPHGNWAAK